MKEIGITKIKVNNPVIASYVKQIRTWDKEGKFPMDDNYFYGIFLDDIFLGASTMQYDQETKHVDIFMLNGSNNNYERIQKESSEQLTNIALNNYGAKTVEINGVKKLAKVL